MVVCAALCTPVRHRLPMLPPAWHICTKTARSPRHGGPGPPLQPTVRTVAVCRQLLIRVAAVCRDAARVHRARDAGDRQDSALWPDQNRPSVPSYALLLHARRRSPTRVDCTRTHAHHGTLRLVADGAGPAGLHRSSTVRSPGECQGTCALPPCTQLAPQRSE